MSIVNEESQALMFQNFQFRKRARAGSEIHRGKGLLSLGTGNQVFSLIF